MGTREIKIESKPTPRLLIYIYIYDTLPFPRTLCKYLPIIADMTTRQSDVASDFLYIAPPPIYGFVIEKEFPATLFSFLPL